MISIEEKEPIKLCPLQDFKFEDWGDVACAAGDIE
jgi:hypothetical protein